MEMPAADFIAWRRWRGRHGFPVDRLVWGLALVGEYLGATWGGKLRAEQLIPKLESRDVKNAKIRAWLERVGREA
jgi:hypothetical protein